MTAVSSNLHARKMYPRWWWMATAQSENSNSNNRRRIHAAGTTSTTNTCTCKSKTTPQALALLAILPLQHLLLLLLLFDFAATPAGATASGGGLSLNIDHAPCVRLFHSGGDVGCRTRGHGGVTGPLLIVDSARKVENIEGIAERRRKKALAGAYDDDGKGEEEIIGLEGGVIAVMPEVMFNGTILGRLSATGLLGGVLVLEEEDIRLGVLGSPDVSTPQGDSTPTSVYDIDASYPWNSFGDGLLMESLDFPVALVTGDSRAEVRSRAASNGDIGGSGWGYPIHTGKMTFYFGGSGMDLNSQACLEWTDIAGDKAPQCLPLGGQSSWASIGPPGESGKDAVFVVAGMDSTSMFHDRSPGANSAVSGLVALLAAAESLGAAGRSGGVDFSALARQIVFGAFQAEAYGFTGSRRFVKDLREGVTCKNGMDSTVSPTGKEACLDPLYPSLEFQKLGRPAHVVSVDQVGYLPASTLWIHSSPEASAEDRGMISRVSGAGGDEIVSVANATGTALPPSPLTAFVKADSTQSGFVLSGYDEAFSFPHYHSHQDTRAMVNASSVAAAALVLAKSALVLAGGTEASAQTLEVNATLVETLLGCILEDWTCQTVKEYVVGELANLEEVLGFRVSVDAPFPPSLYTGPLEFRNGGGLPTVRHTKDDGSWRLHPGWTEKFDPDHDKIQLVPNLLEIFCRAFLSEQAGSAYAGRYGDQACASSGDCPLGECQRTEATRGESETNADSENGSEAESDSRQECARGRCACQRGFHHLALDVGLERDEAISQYTVVDGAEEQGAPLWTEVNWKKIGVEVFLDPGEAVGKVTIGVGMAVTAVAGVVSWMLFRSLSKHKLL